MPKKKQKVVRWPKVLKAMGACDFLTTAFRWAGEPPTLDGMIEYMQRSGSGPRSVRGHVWHLLNLNGLTLRVFGTFSRYRGHGFLWDKPFTESQIETMRQILEEESDARGLTEWI